MIQTALDLLILWMLWRLLRGIQALIGSVQEMSDSVLGLCEMLDDDTDPDPEGGIPAEPAELQQETSKVTSIRRAA